LTPILRAISRRGTCGAAEAKLPVGRTGGAQCLHSPDGGPEAESGYPLSSIIDIQPDNSTYFSNT
jgi:hypothetical protein